MQTIANKKLTTGISVFSLAMLITGSIDSIRNLPTTALFGPALLFFFIFSAIVFLIPAGLIAAELASTWTNKSGVYQWTKMAFGEKTAFFTIWLQWINTLVWYPTILSFIAGTVVFLFDPTLADNKFYLMGVILFTFWLLTLLNLKGVYTSAKFAEICAVLGMIIPMVFIISLFFIWLLSGKPLQIHFTMDNVFPSFAHSENWFSLTAIMTAFLGMELAAVHVNHVKNPSKTFPKALFISVFIILATMILGSLSIAYVIPKNNINLVDGIMQAFQAYLDSFHMAWLMPILVVLIFVGSLGSMINWIISPAKGLLHAAEDGFLPEFMKKKNKNDVPANLLLIQASIVTMACFVFILMPSVNGSYWLLTDLSTQLYMIMYVFLFITAIILKFKFEKIKRSFAVPGGKIGMLIVGLLGLFGTLTTIIVGFLPPTDIQVGSAFHYEIVFVSGLVMMILPVFLFYLYQKNYPFLRKSVLLQ